MSDLASDGSAVGAEIVWKNNQGSLLESDRALRSIPTTPEGLIQSGLAYAWEGGVPVVPRRSTGRTMQLAVKRAMDIVASSLFLLFFAPVLIGLMIAVRVTSPGPVFFKQKRVGLDGHEFEIFKFRTMYVDLGDSSGVRQTVDGDTRVTPLGRFMRRRSLDELPQLLNVFLGTMSLVGPRPHVAGQLAAGRPCTEVIAYYEMRHAMTPGLTGWAQVNGYRGPTDTIDKARSRVDHDLAYIQNFSVMLDCRIIWRTFVTEVITGSGS